MGLQPEIHPGVSRWRLVPPAGVQLEDADGISLRWQLGDTMKSANLLATPAVGKRGLWPAASVALLPTPGPCSSRAPWACPAGSPSWLAGHWEGRTEELWNLPAWDSGGASSPWRLGQCPEPSPQCPSINYPKACEIHPKCPGPSQPKLGIPGCVYSSTLGSARCLSVSRNLGTRP